MGLDISSYVCHHRLPRKHRERLGDLERIECRMVYSDQKMPPYLADEGDLLTYMVGGFVEDDDGLPDLTLTQMKGLTVCMSIPM